MSPNTTVYTTIHLAHESEAPIRVTEVGRIPNSALPIQLRLKLGNNADVFLSLPQALTLAESLSLALDTIADNAGNRTDTQNH